MTGLLVAVAIQVVFCIVVLIWLRYKTAGYFSQESTIDSVRQEVNSLLMELEASADRNISIIEDRIQQLRQATAEADKKLAVLVQESRTRQVEDTVYTRLGQLKRQAAASEAPAADAAATEARSGPAAGTGPAPAEPAPAAPASAAPEPAASTPAAEAIPFIHLSGNTLRPERSFADTVLELLERGFSPDIIAAKTGATLAEVDIVVAMEELRRNGARR